MSGVRVESHGLVIARPTRFARTVAIRVPDRSVERGECVLVTGSNGSGKTSLLLTMFGCLRPRYGHATIDGLAPHRFRRARGIGLAPAAPDFPEGWTVGELLSHAARRAIEPTATRAGLPGEALGLSPWHHHRADRLSSGLAARLALAYAALVGEGGLMLLDEPLAHADAAAAALVTTSLRGLRERGTTIVMTSHRVAGYAVHDSEWALPPRSGVRPT